MKKYRIMSSSLVCNVDVYVQHAIYHIPVCDFSWFLPPPLVGNDFIQLLMYIYILTGSIFPSNKLRNVLLPTPFGPTTATKNYINHNNKNPCSASSLSYITSWLHVYPKIKFLKQVWLTFITECHLYKIIITINNV